MISYRRICVYCGSNTGGPIYRSAARDLGTLLAGRGIGIVYGGGRIGLMGILADAALAAGGEVIGIIPEKLLDLELGHEGVTQMHVTQTMAERKRLMAELADAFIAMPGGYGTLEELFEATTWTQLEYHRKPVGLLNVAGFFDHLLAHLDHSVAEGFLRPIHRKLVQSAECPEDLIERLAQVEIPRLEEWIPEFDQDPVGG
jgi:uncharacterized protein (TIGR00730 family)